MQILAGRSIAVRLAVSSLFWSGVVLLVAGLILSTLYLRATERSFDERLLVYANDLAADLVTPTDSGTRDAGSLGDPRFEIPLSGWYWQLGRVDAATRDLRSSRSLLGNPLPTLAPPVADRPFGGIRKESVVGPEDRLLRLIERDIDLGEDGRFVVRVAGPADEISSAVRRFVLALILTFLLLGVGLGVSTLLQIRFGLRPLSDLRGAVSAVRRGEADRISGNYPGDVAPLAEELNLLLEANREILERARTQVGNLAHALKTPLSVIVNEADGPTVELSVRVREQAMLMRVQIEHYLQRARTAALAGTLGSVTDAAPVIEALARTFGKIFQDRDLAIEVSVASGARFRGERQDFEEMVGNLVDNACKWAVSRVRIRVDLGEDGDRNILRVVIEDDGPGLPEGARAVALKRGRRLDETKPGSGLGLSIVVELAGHYGGSLRLGSSRLGGAQAELALPGLGPA
ncbi:sensor histidine kinase [Enterovirga sp.]|uniref:sensor histidine kinase n=1 Tax=Enterovirga sp. TaxID=2026350 RepID=UPI002604E0A6|nr:sensor histidine kinase [Enterovirga sp.]MDB5590647.1 ATPase [Enterovirga sp.]